MGAWAGTIAHNTDGTCTPYIIGQIQGPDGTSLANVVAKSEGYASLDKIARGNYAEFDSKYLDQNSSLSANRDLELTIKSYASGWSYKAYATVNNQRVDLTNDLVESSISGVAQSINLSSNLLTSTESSAMGILTLENYSDGEYVYSTNQNFTLSLVDKPIISEASCTVYNSNDFLKDKNIYVQGKSCANITVVASPTSGATIAKYRTSYNNGDNQVESSASLFTTPVPFANSGENKIQLTAFDTRSLQSSEKELSINVLPYTEPRLSSVVIKRGNYNDSDWYDNTDGDDLKIVCSYTFTAFGIATDNKAKIQVLFSDELLQEHTNLSSGEEVFYITNFGAQSTGNLGVQISDLVEPESWVIKSQEILSTSAVFDVNIDIPAIAVGQLATDANVFKINQNWDLEHSGNRYSRILTGTGDGFIKFARINILKSYLNTPFVFRFLIQSHDEPFELELSYKAVDSVDPEIKRFTYKGDSEYWFYAKKVDTSIWELYVKKQAATDTHITLIDFQCDGQIKELCKITYLSELVATLPESSTQATIIPTVIEQGTSDIWSYRVWSDGTKECWGIGQTYSITLNGDSLWVVYGYTFPFVFENAPIVTCTLTDQTTWSHWANQVVSSVYGISHLVICSQGGANVGVTGRPRFHVIGK